jgi:hypothetical protein
MNAEELLDIVETLGNNVEAVVAMVKNQQEALERCDKLICGMYGRLNALNAIADTAVMALAVERPNSLRILEKALEGQTEMHGADLEGSSRENFDTIVGNTRTLLNSLK